MISHDPLTDKQKLLGLAPIVQIFLVMGLFDPFPLFRHRHQSETVCDLERRLASWRGQSPKALSVGDWGQNDTEWNHGQVHLAIISPRGF